jgi:hypothetical protein
MCLYVVLLKFTDVSVECTTSIFKVEESTCCFLISLYGLFFDLENRGIIIHRMSVNFYQISLHSVGLWLWRFPVRWKWTCSGLHNRISQKMVCTWHRGRKNLRSHKKTTEFALSFPVLFFFPFYLFCFIFCLLYSFIIFVFFLRPTLFYFPFHYSPDRICGLAVRVLCYRSRGPGSIPGTTRFFLRSSGSGTGSSQPRDDNWIRKQRIRSKNPKLTTVGESLRWPSDTLYPLKLVLGRSVGRYSSLADSSHGAFNFLLQSIPT